MIKKIGDVVLIKLSDSDSNIYVVGNAVIDTGTGFNFVRLMSMMGIMKKDLNSFEWVINTHGHFDHVGGNGYFFNAKVAIHEQDAPILEKGDGKTSKADFFDGKLKARPVDRKLKEGDEIMGMKVIHTPGHTPGSICLLDEKRKILFSGDTVFAEGVGRTDLEGGNEDDLEKSLEKIATLKFDMIFPGHGELVREKGNESLKKIIENLGDYV